MKSLVRAELLKLRTTRTAWWMAAATVVAAVLTVALALSGSDDGTAPAITSSEGVRNVFSAAGAGTLTVLVLGLLAVTGEFRHATVTGTLLVTPVRSRVVTAKLITYTLVGTVLGMATAVVTAVVAFPWLAVKDVEITHFGSDVAIVLLGAVAATLLYGLIGVGLGALLRNQVAAVTVSMVWMLFVETLLVGLVPSVGRWLPGGAASALTETATTGGGLLPMWGGALVLAAYAAPSPGLGRTCSSGGTSLEDPRILPP